MSRFFFFSSSIFLHQASVDDVEDLLHDDFGLLALTLFGCNGFVDGQCDGAPMDGFVVAAEHIEGTVDGHGHDGDADFIGEHEGTTLEGSHLTSTGTGAFREDDHGHTTLQSFTCLLHSFGDARDAVGQIDVLRLDTGITYEGNLLQIFFHHPFEVVP